MVESKLVCTSCIMQITSISHKINDVKCRLGIESENYYTRQNITEKRCEGFMSVDKFFTMKTYSIRFEQQQLLEEIKT